MQETYRVVYRSTRGDIGHAIVKANGIHGAKEQTRSNLKAFIGTDTIDTFLQVLTHPDDKLLWWTSDEYEQKLEIA